MNYEKLYYSIIENRKRNSVDGYTEKHHILPVSLGGDNGEDNLVILTAREHFICHYLLTKMFKEGTNEWYRMICAFHMMCSYGNNTRLKRYINSRLYESKRIHFAESMRFLQKGDSNSQFGTRWIFNLELEENKKIKKTDEVPEGWEDGRVVGDFKIYKKRKKLLDFLGLKCKNHSLEKLEHLYKVRLKEEERIKNCVEKYTKWYFLYRDKGFEEFCRFNGYDKSQSNLVTLFNKYVKEFKPQMGKPRIKK